jgi:hypothetical protein
MPRITRTAAARTAVALPVLLLALTACGGSSGTATAGAAATGSPGANGPGGGFGGADFTAIQNCLTAAGISLPTPSGRPSGAARPTDQPRPSGTFNGTPPADGVRPSGAPDGGFGGGMFQGADVQAALKACGIAVPTGRGARPTATPTT